MLEMLLKATHKACTRAKIHLQRGELLISAECLADDTGISKPTVLKNLKYLESCGEIVRTTTKNGTIIRIVNYDYYTSSGKADLPQGLPHLLPQRLPQGLPSTRTIKNEEECTNSFPEFWEVYPQKSGSQREAKAAYKDALERGASHDAIMIALAEATASERWKLENGRYIPSPAKFLEQEHWKRHMDKKKGEKEWNDF